MFKSILAAVDGSHYTATVLTHAISLATTFQSHLTVLTVADSRIFEWATAIGSEGFVPIVPSGVYEEESRKILEEKANKVLEKSSEKISEHNIEFETLKATGSPVDAILEHSHINDLIVMGKRGEYEKWDNDALGATVEAVSRHLRKPLLVTKREFRSFNRILLAYDGSEHANWAMQYVGHLSEKYGSQVTILTICDDADLGHSILKEADQYLENYRLEKSLVLLEGAPHKQITAFAEEHKTDLIVSGAYGRSRIKEAILGSTTEHILRFSSCPVLLAK